MPDIQQHLAVSQKVTIDDLDWAAARAAGLSERERANLEFFADVESQTFFYFLEVAKLQISRDPDLISFLTMWNYEEHFHAQAISKLMAECGCPVPPAGSRAAKLRSSARLRARLEDAFQVSLAKAMPQTFVALWMTWGASQELLTCQGYESLVNNTNNPVLAELARRIGKQERRHYAFYLASARERLEGDRVAQRVVRAILERNWNPAGSGVKSPAEQRAFVANLFDDPVATFGHADERLSALPGLEGVQPGLRWLRRVGLDTSAATPAPAMAAAS